MEAIYSDHGNEINNCDSCTKIGELKNIIICDKKKGIPPRCFYPDEFRGKIEKTGDGVKGIVVVGLNPGSADDKEKNANILDGSPVKWDKEHENWTNRWNEEDGKIRMPSIPFYDRVQQFLCELNEQDFFNLNKVIWTEVFKCELNVELKDEFEASVKYFDKYWRNKIISLCFDLPLDMVEEFVRYYKQNITTIENPQSEEEKFVVSFLAGDHCEDNLPDLLKDIYKKWRQDQIDNKKKAYSINHFLKFKFLKDDTLKNITLCDTGYEINEPTNLDRECFNALRNDDEIPHREILLNDEGISGLKINFKAYLKCFNFELSKNQHEGSKKGFYWHIKKDKCGQNENLVNNKDLTQGIIECPLLLNSNGNNVGQKNVGKYVDVAAHCSGKFLQKELNKIIPKEYPVLCIGKEAFQYVRFLAHDRLVVGMPHSSGSFGGAYRIYNDDSKVYEDKRNEIFQWIKKDPLNNEKEPNSKYFS